MLSNRIPTLPVKVSSPGTQAVRGKCLTKCYADIEYVPGVVEGGGAAATGAAEAAKRLLAN